MDLNYLLARQQVSLMQADRARGTPSRIAHRKRANGYAVLANTMMSEVGGGAMIGTLVRAADLAR